MAKQGGGGKKRGFFGRLYRSIANRMGGGEKIILSTPEAREASQALGLTNQNLTLLKEKYDGIDLDGSGEIDQDEFFDALGENRSPFTDGLFALIDQDGSGTVEFDEYVERVAKRRKLADQADKAAHKQRLKDRRVALKEKLKELADRFPEGHLICHKCHKNLLRVPCACVL